MKRVLVLTYYFPPAGGVAVQRFLKFSKYLPEYGWQPTIVTVKNGAYTFTDTSLLEQIPESLEVFRTSTFEPFEIYNFLRGKKGKNMPTLSVSGSSGTNTLQKIAEYIRANFFIPDARKGWVPFAVRQSLKIIRDKKPDVLITTGPPHSTHLAGLQLKRKTGIKWVADFRDPWSKNMMNEYLPKTASSMKKDREYEELVLNNADMITVIGHGMASDFKNRAKRVEVIHNGFDEEDFNAKPIKSESFFTMRHVGNLILPMNVPAVWRAISELRETSADFKNDFRLEFTGNVHQQAINDLKKIGIDDCIKLIDYVPHNIAIGYMKGANILLFVVPNVRDRDWVITGKLFEYIASNTDMLSIGPINSDAANILRTCGRTEIIEYDNFESIKASLYSKYLQWKKNGVIQINTDSRYMQYSRRNQTKLLAGLLSELSE